METLTIVLGALQKN